MLNFDLDLPVLFEVVLALEALPADLAAERQLGTLVRPLVYHQIVALGEPALAVLAYELAFRTHLPAELSAAHVVLNLHYRKHRARLLSGTVAVNHLVFGNLDDDGDEVRSCVRRTPTPLLLLLLVVVVVSGCGSWKNERGDVTRVAMTRVVISCEGGNVKTRADLTKSMFDCSIE